MDRITISKGDRIAISAKGRTVTGTVISARNHGGFNHDSSGTAPDNWYIEFTDTHRGDDFGYWKQDQDGGTVRKLEETN